jgi:glycerate dehydrogenase
MNIVFLDEDTVSLGGDIDLGGLKALGDYRACALTPADDPLPCGGDAEVLITNKVKLTRERLESLPRLGLVCLAATGYDNVDVEAAKDLGIRVTNAADYARASVVQHVFAMILAFAQRIHDYSREVQAGEWQKSKTFDLLKYHTFELDGKVIGIIGFGSIGRRVANVAESFGMKVVVNDTADVSASGYRNLSIDELLAESDVVSVNCPLTDKTRNLIHMTVLKKMKRTAILINTARGGIVNEQDLADALNEGLIAGAGVDTLSQEPPRGGNPLLGKVKNLVVTPHTAWTTREARQRLMDIVAEKIRMYKAGNLREFVV